MGVAVSCWLNCLVRLPWETPLLISHGLVQATVGVGTVLIWDLILIPYQMQCSHGRQGFGDKVCQLHGVMDTFVVNVCPLEPTEL